MQKYSPDSEAPPHLLSPCSLLPRDASAWRCTLVNQWCWQAASDPAFSKRPLFQVSQEWCLHWEVVFVFFFFSFGLFTRAETYGQNISFIWQHKPSPASAQTELTAVSSHGWTTLSLPKRSWLMALPQKTDSSDLKCINVYKAPRSHQSDAQLCGVIHVSAACMCHLPKCRTDLAKNDVW